MSPENASNDDASIEEISDGFYFADFCDSSDSRISTDGGYVSFDDRYVTFQSNNLVPGGAPTNCTGQARVHRSPVSSSGNEGKEGKVSLALTLRKGLKVSCNVYGNAV